MDVSLSSTQLFYLIVIIGGVTVIALGAVLYLLFKLRTLSGMQAELTEKQDVTYKTLNSRVADVENQVSESQQRALVVGKHMQQLDNQLKQMENQVREVKNLDPSARQYQHAADMVRQGASLEDIMQACDLPRAEAEMLIAMHR